jgi:hypothetical protein
MFWLKACPRCHGDLHEVNEVGDSYVSCLQCGRILTVEQERLLSRRLTPLGANPVSPLRTKVAA